MSVRGSLIRQDPFDTRLIGNAQEAEDIMSADGERTDTLGLEDAFLHARLSLRAGQGIAIVGDSRAG